MFRTRFFRPRRSLLCAVILCLATATLPVSSTFGQDDDIPVSVPESNADLVALYGAAESVVTFASGCDDLECPEFDCETAGQVLQALHEAAAQLQALAYWLDKSHQTHKAHFDSLAESGSQTTEQLGKTIWAQGVHHALHDFGSVLLDLASVAGTVEDLLQNPADWKKSDIASLIKNVDKLYEAGKDLESGASTVANNLSQAVGDGSPAESTVVSNLPGLLGVSEDNMGTANDLKSDASDLGSIIGELGELKELRDTLKELEGLDPADFKKEFMKKGGKNLAGIGTAVANMVGRHLKAYSDSLMKERDAIIDQLGTNLSAEDAAQSAAFDAMQAVLTRKFEAMDTLAKVREAKEALLGCMSKFSCTRSLYTPRIGDFVQISADGIQIEDVSGAVDTISAELADLTVRISDVITLEDNCEEEDESAYGFIGDPFSEAAVLIGSDAVTWCTYTPGTTTPVDLAPPWADPTDPGIVTAPPGGGGSSGGSTPPPGGADSPGGSSSPGGPGSSPGGVDFPGMSTPLVVDGGEGPCDELKNLRIMLTHVWRWAMSSTGTEKAEAEARLEEIGNKIKDLEKDCPKDGLPAFSSPAGSTVSSPGDTPQTESPGTTVTIYVKAKQSVLAGDDSQSGIPGQLVKLFDPSTTNVALPGGDADKDQTGFDADPIQGTTDDFGELVLTAPAGALGLADDALVSTPYGFSPAFEIAVNADEQTGRNIRVGDDLTPTAALALLPEDLQGYVTGVTVIGSATFISMGYPVAMEGTVVGLIDQMGSTVTHEEDLCRDKQANVNDPYFVGKGSWKQTYDDQWAIKRVGLTNGPGSAWDLVGPDPQPIVVAVIDTGLDWNHLDFDWTNIWKNENEVPDNGVDDDNNGFIDDIIGWNFYDRSNNPWDHDGHGTIVSGIIAARQNNGVGMAGINPYARIMVLKALNSFGHSRASYLAAAIVYAVDNGARVINMSVGGKEITAIEREAIDYAHKKGVLIIAASGNEGINVEGWGIAGSEHVMTVAATGMDDKRAIFSNWGRAVDIAAPGMDILSLRARRTDTMLDIPGVKYVAGGAYVGDDKRYYRASGTSFSAPIITGVASLLLSKDPTLSADEVRRLLVNSARDIDVVGVDQYSGYGLVDARAALSADRSFFIDARVNGVEVVNTKDGTMVRVLGTADADKSISLIIEIGAGVEPKSWKRVASSRGNSIHEGALGDIPAADFAGSATWQIRLVVEHKNGTSREARFRLDLQ